MAEKCNSFRRFEQGDIAGALPTEDEVFADTDAFEPSEVASEITDEYVAVCRSGTVEMQQQDGAHARLSMARSF